MIETHVVKTFLAPAARRFDPPPENRSARRVNSDAIFALERPEPALWRLYLIRSVLSGPAIFITLPVLWFRYYTLRYRFDAEGIHMKVGILFRREVNVTYARIQDIHLNSGIIQRWLRPPRFGERRRSPHAAAARVTGMKDFHETQWPVRLGFLIAGEAGNDSRHVRCRSLCHPA